MKKEEQTGRKPNKDEERINSHLYISLIYMTSFSFRSDFEYKSRKNDVYLSASVFILLSQRHFDTSASKLSWN